jgi:hypothetical protein
MVDYPKLAAASIYPNLAHDDGRQADWVAQRRERNDVASAMYPPPKSALPNRPRQQSADVRSLAQRCDENPAFERDLAMLGLIRRR